MQVWACTRCRGPCTPADRVGVFAPGRGGGRAAGVPCRSPWVSSSVPDEEESLTAMENTFLSKWHCSSCWKNTCNTQILANMRNDFGVTVKETFKWVHIQRHFLSLRGLTAVGECVQVGGAGPWAGAGCERLAGARLESQGPLATTIYTIDPGSVSLQGANGLSLTFSAFPLKR